MTQDYNIKAKELAIDLANATAPVANYIPFVVSGKIVFISGQIAVEKGQIKYKGKVGKDLSLEDGKKAAELCAKNIVAQLYKATGDNLNKVKRCIKLGVFVNSGGDFIEHPTVANGASDLIVHLFGEKGKHVRAAVGSYSLPRDTAVEVEAIFELE
ncbi:MAG: RidA family protein [Alphaproteobacteria bacterium]|jgi:enamine deaminase RidA (YjgF/YER057c/UK114 family)